MAPFQRRPAPGRSHAHLPLLARLWEADIFHAVFLAPDHPNPEHLVRALSEPKTWG